MTAVKYHGGRNYKNRINKHTPNRRNNHPRNPPTPTPKPSLSIPLRACAMVAPPAKPIAALHARLRRRAPLRSHATQARLRGYHDAQARVMARRHKLPRESARLPAGVSLVARAPLAPQFARFLGGCRLARTKVRSRGRLATRSAAHGKICRAA